MANQRQGTHKSKERSEISGSTRKELVHFREEVCEGVVGNREDHRWFGRPKCSVNYMGGRDV